MIVAPQLLVHDAVAVYQMRVHRMLLAWIAPGRRLGRNRVLIVLILTMGRRVEMVVEICLYEAKFSRFPKNEQVYDECASQQ
jgi:hypothetical protein